MPQCRNQSPRLLTLLPSFLVNSVFRPCAYFFPSFQSRRLTSDRNTKFCGPSRGFSPPPPPLAGSPNLHLGGVESRSFRHEHAAPRVLSHSLAAVLRWLGPPSRPEIPRVMLIPPTVCYYGIIDHRAGSVNGAIYSLSLPGGLSAAKSLPLPPIIRDPPHSRCPRPIHSIPPPDCHATCPPVDQFPPSRCPPGSSPRSAFLFSLTFFFSCFDLPRQRSVPNFFSSTHVGPTKIR